jgi:biofilm PGA synthesis protein PgaD
MPLIIDRPALVPLSRRVGWGLVTLFFWAVWVYLWMPLVTLAAWSFGLYRVYSEFRWEAEVMELKRLAVLYLIVACALGGSLLLWAFTEYMRFRNSSRRSMPQAAAMRELAAVARLQEDEVLAWQVSRCVTAHHDEQGLLIGVDSIAEARLLDVKVSQP